jgi:hypothetical protein
MMAQHLLNRSNRMGFGFDGEAELPLTHPTNDLTGEGFRRNNCKFM